MPEISRFYGIIIKMYFDDHAPPHFHAEYQEYKAEYDIRTFRLIKGKLPNTANRLVLEWASEHQVELLENWEKSRKPEPLKKISPLA
ncbi:MAG TPA: DUF4160 domain-containing protein [Candidatus Kapabacteria bacterium]|jgi:hypothetical protein